MQEFLKNVFANVMPDDQYKFVNITQGYYIITDPALTQTEWSIYITFPAFTPIKARAKLVIFWRTEEVEGRKESSQPIRIRRFCI